MKSLEDTSEIPQKSLEDKQTTTSPGPATLDSLFQLFPGVHSPLQCSVTSVGLHVEPHSLPTAVLAVVQITPPSSSLLQKEGNHTSWRVVSISYIISVVCSKNSDSWTIIRSNESEYVHVKPRNL